MGKEDITPKEFCIWVEGYLEALDSMDFTMLHKQTIQDKLKLVKDIPIVPIIPLFPHNPNIPYGSYPYEVTCNG